MIKVNLLSPEKKEVAGAPEAGAFAEEEKEAKINVGAIVAAVLLTVGIIGFLYFSQSNTLDNKQKLLAEKRARKAQLDSVLKTLAQLEKTKKNLDRKVKVIGELKSRQTSTVRMMDEVSRALPDWVWLTKMSFSKGVVTLDGRALSNNLIADFINNLDSTGYFVNIRLKSSKRARRRGTEVYDFSISCQFVAPTSRKAV
jgi:type IV pilus assembly protein PilN